MKRWLIALGIVLVVVAAWALRLYWLAGEFMDRGWSMKKLHKLIVMSVTYQQSSAVRKDLAAKDPRNFLLGRQNRLRLLKLETPGEHRCLGHSRQRRVGVQCQRASEARLRRRDRRIGWRQAAARFRHERDRLVLVTESCFDDPARDGGRRPLRR